MLLYHRCPFSVCFPYRLGRDEDGGGHGCGQRLLWCLPERSLDSIVVLPRYDTCELGTVYLFQGRVYFWDSEQLRQSPLKPVREQIWPVCTFILSTKFYIARYFVAFSHGLTWRLLDLRHVTCICNFLRYINIRLSGLILTINFRSNCCDYFDDVD
jgi:hypothetical protein